MKIIAWTLYIALAGGYGGSTPSGPVAAGVFGDSSPATCEQARDEAIKKSVNGFPDRRYAPVIVAFCQPMWGH
jgi:hypothetical protein